ncbi:N-acetylmuramoyl-L-alanine amidase [Herpetosiphon gulosus]|uniref:N-acetylmuramoyl-L-alanine amidase domain-containing protein n=1 Tax=Herpetosiphon gulosus TaxID=1973496 RepID=A0ABP9WZ64_9CHLR
MTDANQPLQDEPLPSFDLPDPKDAMPHEDTLSEEGTRGVVPVDQFLYIGQGLKADEFTHYVDTYNFGAVPPNFVVLHHTAVPSTAAAPYPSGWRWDNQEAGLSEGQIYRKRLKQLETLREYYRTSAGWDRGPHLFIDETWIWLFTPMYDQGIHAAQGNGYRDSKGTLQYSIGIEVCGYFEKMQWSAPVAALVGHAVAVLKRKLNSFEIRYQKFGGGISSHRDYNKPSCPGAAITESYYISTIQNAFDRLSNVQSTPIADSPITTNTPLLSATPSGSREKAIAFIRKSLPDNSEYKNDIETIMGYYWVYAPSVGLDPFLAAAQCIFETAGLTSGWAARPKRNPAGLGVRQEGGLSFSTWDGAVQAHIGQLLALALRDDEANQAQKTMMAANPRHGKIPANLRGVAKTLAGLSNNWTDDADYANKFATRAEAIRKG